MPLTGIVEQIKSEHPNIVSLTGSSEPKEHTRAKTFPILVSFLLQFSQKFSSLSKHNGRGQRPKISQSEGESAGESGERRRWEHAEYVLSSSSFLLLSSLSLLR